MSKFDDWHNFNRKKKRAEKLVAFLNGVRELFGLDRFFKTDFARDFSAASALDQNKPYLRPQEFKDADEEQLFSDLVNSFVADTEEMDESIARHEDGSLDAEFIDPHWGHTTGHLCGRLEIDKLEWLHPDLRVGLFKDPGEYEVYARPNYLYDDGLPIAINRMSLKLRMPVEVPNTYDGVAHELDLLLSEGLAPDDPNQPDGQGFFFRDARQLLMGNTIKNGMMPLAEVLFDGADAEIARSWKKDIFEPATDKLYDHPQTHKTWDCKWYYSAGPYALGPGAMKFALGPHDESVGDKIRIFNNPAKGHADAFARTRANMSKVKFDLMLQIATEDSIRAPEKGDPPKCVMAAEYTDLAWNTDHTKFEKVGTLTLSPHDVDPSDHDTYWHAMKFSAFNTFEETRPLGQLFRARKLVHRTHRETRIQHSFNDDPKVDFTGKCPFKL